MVFVLLKGLASDLSLDLSAQLIGLSVLRPGAQQSQNSRELDLKHLFLCLLPSFFFFFFFFFLYVSRFLPCKYIMGRGSTLPENPTEDSAAYSPTGTSRSNSLPLETGERWTEEVKTYVPSTKPSCSISLTSGSKGRRRDKWRFLAPETGARTLTTDTNPLARQDSAVPSVAHVEDIEAHAYDSDEEDKRNGVPVTYSQCPGRAFRPSMKDEAIAEFRVFQSHASKLTSRILEQEKHYKKLRGGLFYGLLNPPWTAERWEELILLDDSISTLQAELYAVQEKMEHRYAELYSFLDHARPAQQQHQQQEEGEVTIAACSTGMLGMQKEGVTVSWALGGTDVRRAGHDGDFKLEWNGVEYTSLTPANALKHRSIRSSTCLTL